MKQKLNTLILALLALTIGGCASYDVPVTANDGGTRLHTLDEGTSMFPEYHEGDQFVTKDAWDDIKIGDDVVVRWHMEQETVLHRVRAPGQTAPDGTVLTWRTKGINNDHIDVWHLFPSTYGGTVFKKL